MTDQKIVGVFYAVHSGRKPGIYSTWSDCKDQTSGYKNAVFKKFSLLKEAELFVTYGYVPCEKRDFLYAVHCGRKPGVYMSWADCQPQVCGYKLAVYKKFPSHAQALFFVDHGYPDPQSEVGTPPEPAITEVGDLDIPDAYSVLNHWVHVYVDKYQIQEAEGCFSSKDLADRLEKLSIDSETWHVKELIDVVIRKLDSNILSDQNVLIISNCEHVTSHMTKYIPRWQQEKAPNEEHFRKLKSAIAGREGKTHFFYTPNDLASRE